MALLYFTNGTKKTVAREVAEGVWNVLIGTSEPINAQQEHYVLSVHKVVFNWRNAPDSYIRANLKVIVPLATREWACDRQGQLARPVTDGAWDFARKWGLWEFGRPTPLVL